MATGILSSAYRVAVTAASPVVAVGLACSARGRRRYAERFGAWEKVPPVQWWAHGASVGEVQGLLPLLARIRTVHPEHKVLLSSTSPTGLDRGAARVDYSRLLPIDLGICVRKALARVSAERFILAETELWPTFLTELNNREIPVHIVNGRVSDYTFGWYRRFRSVFSPILERVQSVSVSDESQRSRFIELGARPEVTHITGHTKYDTEPIVVSEKDMRDVRAEFFPGEPATTPVVVLGSLRPGEEGVWLTAIRGVLSRGEPLKVIVAPRHMEKLEYFTSQLTRSGLSWRSWSDRQHPSSDLVLLDTMGRLERAYSIASLAFIGGTLVDIGGHNPLEPAMYGVPTVVGPYVSVIREVVQEMRSAQGILEVSLDTDLTPLLMQVTAGDPLLRDVGTSGRGVWLKHRGSAERVLSVIAHAQT